MSCAQTLCDLMDSKRPIIYKLLSENGGFESLLNEVLGFNTTKELRKRIIETFVKLSTDTNFMKSFAPRLYVPEVIYEIYLSFSEFREDILFIAINASIYFTYKDVSELVMPMLEIDKLSNTNSILLFQKMLLQKRLTESWFTKNNWIFKELNRLLNSDSNSQRIIVETLYSFTNMKYYSNNRVSNILRLNLWKSSCREKIFILSNSQDKNIMMYSQYLLLNISNFMGNKDGYKIDLSSSEFQEINYALSTSNWQFGIHFLSNFRKAGIHKVLPDDILRNLMHILEYNREQCGWSLLIFDLIIMNLSDKTDDLNSKNCKNVLTVLHKHNDLFSPTAIYEDNSITFLKRLIEITQIINANENYIQHIKDKVSDMVKTQHTKEKLLNMGINLEYPNEFICPITQDVMDDPVVASDGNSYERHALIAFMSNGNGKSPLTREKLNPKVIIKNMNLKKRIRDYAEEICELCEKRIKV